MQYVWQFRLWPARNMVTVDGRRIQVLDPGLHNHGSGPDFFNAKVIIDGQEWVGDIEIHVRASDWHRHHHDTDVAYDSVVLHVVDVDDAAISRTNGEVIPQMVMRCAPDFSEKYSEMVYNTFRELPCGNELSQVPQIFITDWISALGFERLYQKTDRIRDTYTAKDCNWLETIYVTLARALGFSTNSQPFELLANSTPLKHMLHHTDSLVSVEAMLFGQAGFLDGLDPRGDAYIVRLIDEYKFMKAKYGLRQSQSLAWKKGAIRPQNSPLRRIAALAKLINNNFSISNKMMEAGSEAEARTLFDINLTGYWKNHYNFHAESGDTSGKAFGYVSTTVLLINVVVPVMMAYAISIGDLNRQERAVDLLSSLKPESNRIIETFIRAGITPENAFHTQALIQLKRSYCEQRKCLYCRIGHRLLSGKVVRCHG